MKNLESFTDNCRKVRHKHWGVQHTNGILECLQCGKFIMKREKAHAYQGKAYEGKIEIKEGDDDKSNNAAV
jgi:hypothetical protein